MTCLDLLVVHRQDVGGGKAAVDLGGGLHAARGKRAIALGQLHVGFQQVLQVAMEETVVPHRRQQGF